MKYCRFSLNQETKYGLIESVAGQDTITRTFLTAPGHSEEELEDLPSKKINALPFANAILHVPVHPSKIICVGRNYREHAAELGHDVPTEPLIFMKPPSSLLAPGKNIRRPKISERVDFEGELGVIIGKTCSKLSEADDVKPYILGYTCVNDVTARDLQNKDNQWTRAKGFDTFCAVGPLVTQELDPWAGVGLETRVNGEIKQQGNTKDFIYALDAVIRYISNIMTLLPGDLIATGTPKGVGPIVAGDTVTVTVDGVGMLSNPVMNDEN
jgi:2-keto-4-pentenoate hydratase/2-oxohepta-3-ene-1,7-dioic acid hydratase in catechol pathway